jgi:hypothetical protein
VIKEARIAAITQKKDFLLPVAPHTTAVGSVTEVAGCRAMPAFSKHVLYIFCLWLKASISSLYTDVLGVFC